MSGRSVPVDSETLIVLRVIGAIWRILEWLLVIAGTIITLVLVIGDDSEETGDTVMHFIDWIDAGTFTLWAVLLLVAPLAVGIGLLTNLHGDLRGWLRKLCFVVAGANLLAAA